MLRVLSSVTLLSLLAVGCQESGVSLPDDLLTGDSPFVAIDRNDGPSAEERAEAFGEVGVLQSQLVREDHPENFYLAIRKDDLHERWFLSAYVRNMFPGAVFGGAARSLDMKVVSFRQQNGKVFLVDADDRKKVSDLFDPAILIDAFPVITDYEPFNNLPGAENYVLIDPAAGLNRFQVVGDLFGSGYGWNLKTELSFVQAFRGIADGVTYEQVFTAYMDDLDPAAFDLWENPYRVAGTLGMALRRYEESENYTETMMPFQPHYFSGTPRLIPNTGQTEVPAAKWAIYEGMKPIEWVISRDVLTLQADPQYADYDIVAAITAGIESWNEAFGFTALTARVALPGEDMGQDDKNFFIVDLDPSAGFAFANWRSNPNTSEIRGASVYLSATFLEGAHASLVDDVEEPEEPVADDPAARAARLTKALEGRVEKKPMPVIGWAGLGQKPLCDMHVSDFMRGVHGEVDSAVMLTKKEKVERTLQEVAAHEVGHTLGLRHNFKGSTVPPSTSVMEYQVSDNAIEHPAPGTYDVAAIRYLYGLSEELPTDPFCTDGDVRFDPFCATFDRGADPLTEDWMPFYDLVWGLLLDIGFDLPFYQDMATNAVLGFVRGGATEEASMNAWNLAIEKGRAPVDQVILDENPFYGPFADKLARTVLARLFYDPPEMRGSISFDPPMDEGLMADYYDQVQANLLNVDGVRSFETRLTMVRILKHMQSVDGLGALIKARTEIAAELTEASGPGALQITDLLSHIDAATQPYFE